MRKRTTYLIINLTVADLLVGAVTGPLEIKYAYQFDPRQVFSWLKFCICMLFPVSSLLNLSLISLERLHATLYPSRHCLIGNWVFFKVIVCCWLLALIFAFLVAAQIASITGAAVVLFYANSMVNPVIYTIRMQEFRKMLRIVICKTKTLERTCHQPIELHEM